MAASNDHHIDFQSLIKFIYKEKHYFEGIRILEQHHSNDPTNRQIIASLFDLYFQCGFTDQYLSLFNKVSQLFKKSPFIYLFYLQIQPFLSDITIQTITKTRCDFAKTFLPPVKKQIVTHTAKPILNIGYYGDLVHLMNLPTVLNGHDLNRVKATVYTADQRLSHYWSGCIRDTSALSPQEIIQQIQYDQIDVLIYMEEAIQIYRKDWAVLSAKPAPIQLFWVNQYATSGTDYFDYIVADPYTITELEYPYYTEKPLFLPQWLSYEFPQYIHPIKPLPALQNGYITFGSSNRIVKLNARVIQTWAQILKQVPNSRLILKDRVFSDEASEAYLRKQWAQLGFPIDRLITKPFTKHPEYYEFFNDIDIALDPFPFTGNITTMETVMMGVPLISMSGRIFFENYSKSWLSVIGLSDFVATTEGEYISKAAGLASDQSKLIEFRDSIRKKIQTSGVLDGAQFARELEAQLFHIIR